MSFTRFMRMSLSLGSLAIVLAGASSARAQSCRDTTQCPQGFVCQISTVPTPPPGGPTCAPDAPGCDKPAADVAPGFAPPQTAGYCQPAPCTADTECGPGMVCHSEERKECSGGTAPSIACAPGTECAKPLPAPEMCTVTKVSVCAYKWQLPCNTDVECGAGFNCMPSVSTSCSAGGSTGGSTSSGGMGTPSSGATAPAAGVPADLVPPTDPKCTTTTSFPGYCQPKATTCTASTDCPAAWTCNEIPSSSVDSGPATRPAADGGAGVAAPMTNDLPAPPPPQNQKVCISPLGYGGTGYRDQSTSNDGKGGGSSTANPEAPPSTGSPATTGGPGESGGLSPKAGCAVGGGAGSSLALVAFGVVGIALARRRRK